MRIEMTQLCQPNHLFAALPFIGSRSVAGCGCAALAAAKKQGKEKKPAGAG
jgi:hypothetical protein